MPKPPAILITAYGHTHTVAEWASIIGINRSTFQSARTNMGGFEIAIAYYAVKGVNQYYQCQDKDKIKYVGALPQGRDEFIEYAETLHQAILAALPPPDRSHLMAAAKINNVVIFHKLISRGQHGQARQV
jgi:hypothetical protein